MNKKQSEKKITLLVIENNPEYLKCAQEYFATLTNYEVIYATTYIDAIDKINACDAVITDLMFPYDNTGSIDEHRKLVEIIVETVRNRWSDVKFCDRDILRNDLVSLQKSMNGTTTLAESGQYSPLSDELSNKRFDEKNATHNEAEKKKIEDKYDKLSEELKSKKHTSIKAEQPMGVLIARACRKINKPYVVVTSGHSAHGDISMPVAVFMQLEGLITRWAGEYGNRDMIEYQLSVWKKKYGEEIPPDECSEHANNLIQDAAKYSVLLWEYATLKVRAQLKGRL